MKRLLLRWVLLAISVVAASLLTTALGLPFEVDVSSAQSVAKLFVGVAVLALLNATLGRLLRLATLPLSCVTLGLFSLVVNAVVLWIAASLDLGFRIPAGGLKGFLAALVASLLISFISGILGVLLSDGDD